ncbi:DUF883 family protein [Salaquimonas pukyongi]|uniref:DUF883 family protein n=1 Tax=Salaquimonas pukyongi TaxID=2712698 RepID=UPI00096B7259|nr:DUF883 family protein [Salaquimonas pukyongi]
MSKTATATTKNGSSTAKGSPKATGDLGGDIDKQINRIRSEIRSLADTVSEAGLVVADDVKTQASAKAGEMRTASREILDDLNKQLSTLEQQLAGHVRRKPVSSLAIAAGIGFLFAFLSRR